MKYARVTFLSFAFLIAGCATQNGEHVGQELAIQNGRAHVLAAGIEQPDARGKIATPQGATVRRDYARARNALDAGQFALSRKDYPAARREAERARIFLDLVQASLRVQPQVARRQELEAQNAALEKQIADLKQSIATLENNLRDMQ